MSDRPTIRDVALRARTSVASVSRFVNSANGLSKGLRTRVEKAVRELKYVPNADARALSKAASDSVGIAVLTRGDGAAASFVLRLAAELGRRGRTVALHVERDGTGSPARVERFALAHQRTIIVVRPGAAPEPLPVRWGSPLMYVFVCDDAASRGEHVATRVIDFALGPLAGPASYLDRPIAHHDARDQSF